MLQALGLAVADAVLRGDLGAVGLTIPDSPASFLRLTSTLWSKPELYGFFGRSTEPPRD